MTKGKTNAKMSHQASKHDTDATQSNRNQGSTGRMQTKSNATQKNSGSA